LPDGMVSVVIERMVDGGDVSQNFRRDAHPSR
jgi:hypothetical protein